MIISIGKKYQDSQDRVVKIISDVASLPFCYIGEVLFTGELLRYSSDGVVYNSNDINLVKELGAAQKLETIRYAVTDNIDKCVAGMAYYSTAKRVHPEQVKVKITIEEIEEETE